MSSEEEPSRRDPDMHTETLAQSTATESTLIWIEVSSEERANIWAQIIKNRFVGRYLGKNRFAFERSELELLRSAGIDFQVLGT
jgi:hypothetical protein